jgi:hypothetical protein
MARGARPRPRGAGQSTPPRISLPPLPRNLRFETRQVTVPPGAGGPPPQRAHWSKLLELGDHVRRFRERVRAYGSHSALHYYLQDLDDAHYFRVMLEIQDWAAKPEIVARNSDPLVLVDWQDLHNRKQWMFRRGTWTEYKPRFAEELFSELVAEEGVTTANLKKLDDIIVGLFLMGLYPGEGLRFHHEQKVRTYRQKIQRRMAEVRRGVSVP